MAGTLNAGNGGETPVFEQIQENPMPRKQQSPQVKSSAGTPDREMAKALLDVALLYRTEHHKLERHRRQRGVDRRWSQLADRARFTRSLFFALLDEMTMSRRPTLS